MNSERIILDRYRLEERIAAGGTAEVWRARDMQLERDVAVKLLHPHLLPDAVSRARLAAEARAAAALNHPAIVAVYDVDADGDSPALVMEYVAGSSLAARLAADGPMAAEEVARIGAEIADALYLAHRRGVVHRDVKPGNILLDREGRPRLVDFGIAHSLALGAERLTMTGTVMGTLRSMAPEQLLGGPITPRTDLYGLGTVLYEALTGRPPYPETSPVALNQAQQAGPPSLPGVPAPLAAVVAGSLQADPAQRPIHAGAIAAALRALLAGDGSPALGIAPRATDVDTAAQTQVHPSLEASTPARPPAAEAPLRARAPAARRPAALPMSMVAFVLAALLLVAILSSGLLRPGAGPGDVPSPTPLPTPSATPSPSPFNIESLPGPIAEEVRKWWEDCGTDGQAPPIDVSAMNKKMVEDALKPLREACKQEEEGD